MRPFFNHDNLHVQLLNTLEQHAKITYTELAHHLQVDRATVTKAVHFLTQSVQQPSLKNVVQIQPTSQGVTYQRAANFNPATLMPVLVDHRLAVIFETVLASPPTTVTSLANRLYVSPSTIRRLIVTINQTLADYQLRVTRSPLTLTGPEANVRYACFQYYWNTYGSVTWPFSVSERACRLQAQQAGIATYDQLRFSYWLAINQQRQLQGHHLTAIDLKFPTPTPETSFLTLIRQLDFDVTNDTHTTALTTELPDIPVLLANESAKRLLQLTARYQQVFGNVPLLYDRPNRLRQAQTTLPADTWAWLGHICHHQPLIMLKVIEADQHYHTGLLKIPIKLALLTDSDAFGRQQTMQTLSRHFASYQFELTGFKTADLVLTNLTVAATRTPVIYVNVPLSTTDFQNVATGLDQLK
ncbi:helix-turn-helix domain-containing protein [Lactiplantibacillus carotarum]|uniref:helix-turn-helix domain-containing protein n=1 Tax=Lactiplantibacillus carotarum TaxID=2993456 RepID=UPI00298EF6EA|nr:helix-turn-helix domain-containing protein [Lactiplantibacillus carotarum]